MTSIARELAGKGRDFGVRPDRVYGEILIGALTTAAAAALRTLLAPGINLEAPFLTFFPAVAIAAWLGGIVGGVTATILSGAFAAYFLLDPPGTFAIDQVVPFLLFLLGSVVISIVGGRLHGARQRAEEEEVRATFLADASSVLATGLDMLGTVEALARVAVPQFADWCAIDLVDESGEFTDVRIAHSDPARIDLGYALRRGMPVRTSDPTGPAKVLRTGEAEFVPRLSPAYADATADRHLAAMLRDLRVRSYICVPLSARGRGLGALSVFMSDSGRTFTERDLATARELAGRAAVALDHARLFEGVRARSQELDAVLGSMDDAVLIVDHAGRIASHNPAAERVLGAELPAGLDEALGRLSPAAGAPGVLVAADTGRHVRVSTLLLQTDGGPGRIVLLRDVTELLESQAARDAFLGMLSHELRTPITTIFGAANMLRKPIDPSIRSELLADLVAESDRLYRLVEDLLVLSRFERGRLEASPEPVLLQRVLPRLVEVEEQRWPGVSIHLAVESGLPAVVADTTYVEQVIRNLLSNAAKYGGAAGPIQIRAQRDPDADAVRVVVEDLGPGIPPGQEERIFKLYERLPEATQSFAPGAGIGLFVCRRLVELMGGTITVGPGDGGGARFTVTLPSDHSGDEITTDTDLVDVSSAASGSSPDRAS